MSCIGKAFAEKSNFLYKVTKDYYKLCKNDFITRKIRMTVPLIVTNHLKNSIFKWKGDRHFGSANGDKKISRCPATHKHIQDKPDSNSLISLQKVVCWIKGEMVPSC